MSPLERLRLNATLTRLLRDRTLLAAAGPSAGVSRLVAENAAEILATLQKLGLQFSYVSIYNSGTPSKEPGMTTTPAAPENVWIKRLMPSYVKHREALAVVQELEAKGEKPTGPQKANLTRTRKDFESEMESARDYGRQPERAPKEGELAAIYDAKVEAARAEREHLAGQPTLTVDELQAKAFAALDAKKPHPKYGNREAKAETMHNGTVITAVAADDRAGRYIHSPMKRTIRFLQDGKVISKDSLLKLLGGRERMDINEALRSAFEAQAPALEADYREYVLRTFEYVKEKSGGSIPVYVGEKDPLRAAIVTTIAHHGRRVGDAWELDEELLAKQAKRYGEETAVQWFYKTNAKLGALENPVLHEDRGGHVKVSGERAGRKVYMDQQRIMKWSSNNNPFHQFPARLYVDGKFTTEEQYRKLFGDK